MKKFLTIVFILAVGSIYSQDIVKANDKAIENEDNSIYSASALQVQPLYTDGGMKGFHNYFKSKFKKKKIKDVKDQASIKIFISFVVEKDGNVSNIRILRSVSEDAGEQTIKVLKKMPKWNPGVQNGLPVRASMTLPITINFTE